MTVLAPASCLELRQMLRWAVTECDGPVAVRYPRGGDGGYSDSLFDPDSGIAVHKKGKDCAIITYGTLVNNCLLAAQLLKDQGIDAAVIRLTKLNPLPLEALKEVLSGIDHILLVEEACHGSGICDALQCVAKMECVDLGSEYVTHGSIAQLYEKYGLDAESIAARIQEVRSHEN